MAPSQSSTPFVTNGAAIQEKLRPWIGVKPKKADQGVDTVRHEFKEGDVVLDFASRGCSF